MQGPRILGVLFGSLRGYAGKVSPAAALDMAASDANTYIVDLRSSSEKVLPRLVETCCQLGAEQWRSRLLVAR